jgi:hypothetical protein
LILAATQPIPLGEQYLALARARAAQEESPDTLPVYRQRQGWFLLPAFILLSVTLLIPESRGRQR